MFIDKKEEQHVHAVRHAPKWLSRGQYLTDISHAPRVIFVNRNIQLNRFNKKEPHMLSDFNRFIELYNPATYQLGFYKFIELLLWTFKENGLFYLNYLILPKKLLINCGRRTMTWVLIMRLLLIYSMTFGHLNASDLRIYFPWKNSWKYNGKSVVNTLWSFVRTQYEF